MATICIVDDDRSVREALADLVQSLGYEVATYESAEDFLHCGLAQTCCLITDLQMPGLNGLELQSELVAHGHAMPIIFVTAFSEEKFQQRAMQAGAIGFLNKPFDEAELIECIETALSIVPDQGEASAV